MKKQILFSVILSCLISLANAQWQQIDSTNVAIYCIAVNGSNIFAGTSGGVIYSSNNGVSWVTSGLTSYHVYALAISGSNIFAGTYGGGVYISSNNGSNWIAVNNGLTDNYVMSLAISGNSIYAGIYDNNNGGVNGVFMSSNNGNSWTSIGLTNQYITSLAINGCKIFAGGVSYYGYAPVYLSTNNGSSWDNVNNGLPYSSGINALAISGNNIFAISGGIYYSSNNGSSWSAVNNGIPHQNNNIYSLAIIGSNIFIGTLYNGVYYSSNNGSSWTSIGLTNYGVTSLVLKGGIIYAGTGYEIYKKTIGVCSCYH